MRAKIPLILIMLNQLAACTLIPGQHMSPFSKKSSEKMPVTVNDETVLKKLEIQTIDAQLIIELEKDLKGVPAGQP